MSSPLLSRKFIYAILVVVAGFILVVVGKATADQWMTFTTVMGGIYVIGNVATKVVVPGDQTQQTSQPPL